MFCRGGKQAIDEALRLFRRAMELDPDYPCSYCNAMWCYAARRGFSPVDEEEVRRLLQTAIRVGQDDASALSAIAWTVAFVLRDPLSAKRFIDQALALNTNLALAWGTSGFINLWLGHPGIAVEHVQRALRHDPHYNLHTGGLLWGAMAHACFFLGRHVEAVSWAEGELQRDPDSHTALRIGAAGAAHAGKLETARRLGRQLQSVDPVFRVSRLADYLRPYQKPEFVAKYRRAPAAGPPTMTRRRSSAPSRC